MTGESVEQTFLEAFQQRKELILPVNLSSLLNLFEIIICERKDKESQFFATTNFQLFNCTPEMQKAFRSKSRYEKINHYCFCVNFLKEVMQDSDMLRKNWSTANDIEPRTMQATVFRNSNRLRGWVKTDLSVDVDRREILVGGERLNLRNYYMRDSKNSGKRAVIFESLTNTMPIELVRVGFTQQDYSSARELLQKIVNECQRERLYREMKKAFDIRSGVRAQSCLGVGSVTTRQPTDTKQSSVCQFKRFEQSIREKYSKGSTNNAQLLFENCNKKIKVKGRTFYLQELFMLPKEKVVEGLKVPGQKWNPVVLESNGLNRPDNVRSQIVTEKCHYNGSHYVLNFVRDDQSNVKEGKLVYTKTSEFVGPAIPSPRINFSRGEASVLSITENESKLYLQMEMDTCDVHNNEFALAYMKSVSNIFEALHQEECDRLRLNAAIAAMSEKKRSIMGGMKGSMAARSRRRDQGDTASSKSNMDQTVYFSANGNDEVLPDEPGDQRQLVRHLDRVPSIFDQPIEQEIKQVTEENIPAPTSNISTGKVAVAQSRIPSAYPTSAIPIPTSPATIPGANSPRQLTNNFIRRTDGPAYLRTKHFLGAGAREPLKILQRHLWEDDWAIVKGQGVTCTNKKKLEEQKKVFGHILKTMGKNILKSKNILNVSFPITIFKTESIATNFTYAPLILDRTTSMDALQRLKWLIIFDITIATTSICTDKPFNPLLGETYQGHINQCPISLEQVSHHPPISSYFYVGRGYRVFGSVEPKIDLGLNVGHGYTDRPNRILYDDGTLIQMSFVRLALHGIMFGDRSIKFEHKCFVYDTKNSLFAEIECGPRKKSFFGKNSDPDDFIFGRIVRVHSSFYDYFKKNDFKAYPSKQHITETLSMFEGIWSETIKFDGKVYFNFLTEHPCPLEDYPAPLESDGRSRTDLIKFLEGNMNVAQQEKQRVEERQRADAKLREKRKR